MATLKRVAEDTPRPIREIISEVPEWLCSIISKLRFKSWLRSFNMLLSRPARNRRQTDPRRNRRLGFDALEDRAVPSATVITATTAVDYTNNGSVDLISRTAETYDNHRNLLSQVVSMDWNADGTINQIVTLAQSFDHWGNQTREQTLYDMNGDGVPEYGYGYVQQFDSHGRINKRKAAGASDSVDRCVGWQKMHAKTSHAPVNTFGDDFSKRVGLAPPRAPTGTVATGRKWPRTLSLSGEPLRRS